MDTPQSHTESRLWYLLLGRGLLGVFVGLLLSSNPWAPSGGVAALFVGYLLADGVLGLLASGRLTHEGKRSRELVFVGVVDLLAALAVVLFPAAAALRTITGVRCLATGVGDTVWSRRILSTELYVLAGAASVIAGALVLAWPGSPTNAVPWLLAIATIAPGALLIAGSLSEIRRLDETLTPLTPIEPLANPTAP